MKEPILYRIVRPIITFLFKFVFHPRVIGRENIPDCGKVILAGNHTNFLDCVLLISSTKRTVHFLAKYELINGVFGFIFRNMGIIPVNRKATRNTEAFDSAICYLNDDKVIGIFPEGTINREMKDVTLLFKKGVVRMAYQANSFIIPFSITGRYRIFGRGVTVVFGRPYVVGSDNYEVEIDKFREEINRMIIERR